MTITLVSADQALKDFYPLPGARIKQYVVDMRRQSEWESRTCPRFDVPDHEDNTGASCRNAGSTSWTYLDHDCCSVCGVLMRFTENAQAVQSWLAEKALQPPIESDKTKLSDECAEDASLRASPIFAMLRSNQENQVTP